ncbi:MAG: response regulator transcription factor [bacterium]|nr:response regulator transcription factor [Candidatus Kapabacteria bacterium]
MAKTVLVVDDEEDIVSLLRYNLEKEGYNVLTALDGESALATAEQTLDLVVLEVMMPGVDGFEVCRRLRSTPLHSTTPIMFLTARAADFDQVLGLELGADDYIQKPISPRVFVARVKSILRRSAEAIKTETIVMPEVLHIGELEINRQNYTVRVEGAETFFPKKEFELLAFLVSNPGKVFSRETLLNKIWGENVYVLDRTVDVHVSKVREKLGTYSALIETVKGVGYRFRN